MKFPLGNLLSRDHMLVVSGCTEQFQEGGRYSDSIVEAKQFPKNVFLRPKTCLLLFLLFW